LAKKKIMFRKKESKEIIEYFMKKKKERIFFEMNINENQKENMKH